MPLFTLFKFDESPAQPTGPDSVSGTVTYSFWYWLTGGFQVLTSNGLHVWIYASRPFPSGIKKGAVVTAYGTFKNGRLYATIINVK